MEELMWMPDAQSFPGLNPPAGAKYIGSIYRGSEEYMFYKNDVGEFLYETRSGYAIKLEMEKARKRKMEEKRHKKAHRIEASEQSTEVE